MTPSSGASKAEFYDALQGLQVRKLHITGTIHTWLGSGTRNEVCYNP